MTSMTTSVVRPSIGGAVLLLAGPSIASATPRTLTEFGSPQVRPAGIDYTGDPTYPRDEHQSRRLAGSS
jgi:hypothetical protein